MTSPPEPTKTRMIAVPIELEDDVERLIATQGVPPTGAFPLDYHLPTPARRPVMDWMLTLVLSLLAAALTGICFVFIPKMEAIFMDFKVELPTGTQWVLNVSRWANHKYGFLIFWLVALGVPALWARVRPWPPRDNEGTIRAARYFVLSVILLGGGVVVAYYVLLAPMVTLIQTVSGPQR